MKGHHRPVADLWEMRYCCTDSLTCGIQSIHLILAQSEFQRVEVLAKLFQAAGGDQRQYGVC